MELIAILVGVVIVIAIMYLGGKPYDKDKDFDTYF